MALDLQEQEQLDALRAFWHRWGKWLFLCVLLGFAVYAGSQAWRYYQRTQAEAAADQYLQLKVFLEKGQVDDAVKQIAQIQKDYPHSAYASRAGLLGAHLAIERKELAAARTALEGVIRDSHEESLVAVARLRLAGVLLDEKKYDEALTMLAQPHDQGFSGMYLQLKGDILLEQGKLADAKTAYTEALERLSVDAPARPLTQIKLDALNAGE